MLFDVYMQFVIIVKWYKISLIMGIAVENVCRCTMFMSANAVYILFTVS